MFERLRHHAYCVAGAGVGEVSAFADALREAFGLERGHQDLVALSVPSFGIDDAHELAGWAANRAMEGGKKFFVLGTDAMTREAQNAFLKVCEEPPRDTHFFILISSAELLIPTLRSRMEVAPLEAWGVSASGADSLALQASEFLARETRARLACAAEIAAALKDEEMTRGQAAAFVAALVREARGKGAFPKARAEALDALARAEEYARDTSASFKILLEHLAVVLPKM